MPREREERLDPAQPALIVTYGNTTRKCRPLDREVILLGRAPGCDLKLVSPEVAPIHCVVVHALDGWRLRDCTGKGTRVNGKAVHDEILHDGDVFQVGSFTFQANLPPVGAPRPATGQPSANTPPRATPLPRATPASAAPMAIPLNPDEVAAKSPKSKRLERSRRRFAELALALRRRLRDSRDAEDRLAHFQTTLGQQAETLRQRQHDCETRLTKLKEGERDLASDRAALENDQKALRERLARADQELAERRAEVEAQIQTAWEECQARCREAEEQLQRRSEVPPPQAPAAADGGPELERRRQELDHYAQHLRQERRQLDEEAQRLAEESARLQREEEQRKRQVQAERPAPVPSSVGRSQSLPAVKNLRAELKVLRQEIENRDVALHEMRRQLQEAQEAAEREVPPSLEAELVRMHLQIERERKELDEQIRQMQLRQTELEEAAREAELQLSRERAQMARDQAELKRVKDELRLEKERLQRGEGLREKLGPVQRLKEKLLQKDPPGDATPKPAGNVGNGPRFRARRGLLGDKPA